MKFKISYSNFIYLTDLFKVIEAGRRWLFD